MQADGEGVKMDNLLLILLILCFVPAVVGVLLERKDWNKGRCPECGKEWVCSGTDLAGDRRYYCKECERSIWISYPWIDRKE